MKILLIITPFYPAQTPNTIRWDAIIHEFINNGYEVTVLTTKWTKKEPFEEINGIKIYRAGHHTLLDFLWNKLGVNKRRNVSSFAKIKKSNFIVAKIERIVDRIWRKRYWPDGSVLFFEPGKKVINKIIREDSITQKCAWRKLRRTYSLFDTTIRICVCRWPEKISTSQISKNCNTKRKWSAS